MKMFLMVLIFFAAVQSANAGLVVRVNFGADGVVSDNGVGDLNPLTGVIEANFSSAQFDVLVGVAQSTQNLGSNTINLSVTYSATGVEGLTSIAVSDSNLTGYSQSIYSHTDGNLGSGVSQYWRTSLDELNRDFAIGSAGLLILGPLTGTQSAHGSLTGFTQANPFSMGGSLRLVSIGGNSGTVGSANASVSTVPEPNSLVIIASLFGGVSLCHRRRHTRLR
ncbi:MAG: hypothetical protein JNL67_04140 [Planctomycetaceae bacterium]|nr:hypothetical protein [Planctomycetaceae bacterium]